MDKLLQDGGKPKRSKTTKFSTKTKKTTKTTKSGSKKGGNFLGSVGELIAPTGWGSFATAAGLLALDRADAAYRRGKSTKSSAKKGGDGNDGNDIDMDELASDYYAIHGNWSRRGQTKKSTLSIKNSAELYIKKIDDALKKVNNSNNSKKDYKEYLKRYKSLFEHMLENAIKFEEKMAETWEKKEKEIENIRKQLQKQHNSSNSK